MPKLPKVPNVPFVRDALETVNATVWRQVNKAVDWHSLPRPLAALNLIGFREDLRKSNLHDTREDAAPTAAPATDLPPFRTYDGSRQDPYDLDMGKAGSRFGRNMPLGATVGETGSLLMTPSPREVSRHLLWRDEFQPAASLNVLAACWIQFMNHGWFGHGQNSTDTFDIPLDADDDWTEQPMQVRRTHPDRTRIESDGSAATYINTVTHWWDGSQIYGSSEERNRELRTGELGKMIVEDDRLPLEKDKKLTGIDATGFNDNYWVGLALLHTLFVKEHNAICDQLHKAYPSWGDEKLFLTARLVNSALMAKIHTIEWTPGILANPVLATGMYANWYGALPQWMRMSRAVGRALDLEGLAGIIGGEQKHHAAPFSITEEFISVYRLHPLIPDDYAFRDHRTGALIADVEFNALQGNDTRAAIDAYGWSDLLYHFGTEHPGAITLHNHPRALMNHTRVTGEHVDLGTIDVLRDRERGVRRYNDFRQLLRKAPIRKFEDLTPNKVWNEEIRDVYAGDIDAVDLQVGLLGEKPPPGFGFSDTAFRIFILMASRRLKSDRFFTNDYSPEIYSPVGLEWVEKHTMADVLVRHHPELAVALEGSKNAFAPWRKAG
ncbi:MAG TPA: peroxidase family protein [Jatrophihabitantaceae bacterium]|nr:peroxidase family protein [Jatrophihabitantaceae bacterium]